MFPSPFGVLFFFINELNEIQDLMKLFPSPFGVLFFFIIVYIDLSKNYKYVSVSFRSFILFYDFMGNEYTKEIINVSVSFRSFILFYPPPIKPLFYDMLFGYFRENYLNFQFSFLKEQKLCSNSHFYSIVVIFI